MRDWSQYYTQAWRGTRYLSNRLCTLVLRQPHFERSVDVVGKALTIVNKAILAGRDKLFLLTKNHWENFWQKSYVELWGNPDATTVEKHYQYFMYIMGCCSENSVYPPNFGGLLFSTRGDLRHWGVMQWWNNLNLYYNAVMA